MNQVRFASEGGHGRRFEFSVLTLDNKELDPIVVRAENKAEAGGVAMAALRQNGQEPIIVYDDIVVVKGK